MLLLVVLVMGQNLTAYALPTPPSFGGGKYHYTDGLTINERTFDISKNPQKIDTQNLPIGKASQITLKIYDIEGPSFIYGTGIVFNSQGSTLFVAKGDTWIQYDLHTGKIVVVHDPHHFISKATVNVSHTNSAVYVTFNIIPQSKMNTSNLVVEAWNKHLSSYNSLVINAISFP